MKFSFDILFQSSYIPIRRFQFESQLMGEVCKLLHINKTRTILYHPQCDGLVERFNRTLLNMLATCVSDHPFDWEKHIRKVCMAYNSSIHSSTGHVPFYLLFGRQTRLPIDTMYGMGEQDEAQSPSEYANTLPDSSICLSKRTVGNHTLISTKKHCMTRNSWEDI